MEIDRALLPLKAKGAFLGAAVGDALGWPFEDRARRVGRNPPQRTESFREWTRRTGGRYFAHTESVLPGEYSDDTQLLLCCARSVIASKASWEHLAFDELPLWLLYERGAGSASKRAANSWLSGRPPWSPEHPVADRRAYLQAGGNGVAMRVMPHVVAGFGESEFGPIAQRILADGVVTHGHPRALVGAQAFAFAVWWALRNRGRLRYGELLDAVVGEAASWSRFSAPDEAWPTWRHTATELLPGQYEDIWADTVIEMIKFLERCQEGVEQGALSSDSEVLRSLGAFDRKVNGAGTVTAAAALFLASRFAADPIHGLIEAAFAEGADTDTLASMTASLLGSIHGPEWLGHLAEDVQDSNYLATIAEQLVNSKGTVDAGDRPRAKSPRAATEATIRKLELDGSQDSIDLPDGRRADVGEVHEERLKTAVVRRWQLKTQDGQTLYIKRISRVGKGELLSSKANQKELFPADLPSQITRFGIRVRVQNLERMRKFYVDVLGLKPSKETPVLVVLAGVLSLVATATPVDGDKFFDGPALSGGGAVLYLETTTFDQLFDRVVRTDPLASVHTAGDRKYFRCRDPEGNEIEVYELAVTNGLLSNT